MTHWKKLYTKHLINTAVAINGNLKINNIRPLIKIPNTLDTEKEIHIFSKEITNAIRFPHLRYLTNYYK